MATWRIEATPWTGADQTGFDIKQLFIGSEGSIGIITAISILCPRRPAATNVAVFSLPSYAAVQEVFKETKSHLGEILSAFEFFDDKSYEILRHHQKETGQEVRKVFETEGQQYILIETSGSNAEHDEEVCTDLGDGTALADRIEIDGTARTSHGQ